jgi:rRNA pseudouridine-1189 N-methylase Emg1 (Nep1/Mra1 family)
MAINFYLTYKDSMLLEDVLKTELAKEVDEYTLNRIINNDYINFINNIGRRILLKW